MTESFVFLSRYAGMREDLVQAGGGNSSVKLNGKTMLVKASGFQLSDLTTETGYSTVDYNEIVNAFSTCENIDSLTEDDSKQILAKTLLAGGRPSIETFLHAITKTFTLHTHPIVDNILTACKDAKSVLLELFPDSIYVPYATPGIELAKTYFKALQGKKEAPTQIIFLQNHGLVVSAANAEEVVEITESVVTKIEAYLNLTDAMLPYHRVTDIWKLFEDNIVWRVTDENVLSFYRKAGIWNHAFCPDCVVFLCKQMWTPNVLSIDELNEFKGKFGEPVIVNWKDNLYIVAASVKKAMEIQSVLSFSAQVMSQVKEENCNFLSDQEQNFLLHWDAEKYRQNIK